MLELSQTNAMNVSSLCRSLNFAHTTHLCCFIVQRRYRYKKKWAVNLPSKTPCELALEHFDAFYKLHFKHQWPSIRVSLLSLSKHAAIINNASDTEITSQTLAELGASDIIQDAAVLVHKASLSGASDDEAEQWAAHEEPGIAAAGVIGTEHGGWNTVEDGKKLEKNETSGTGSSDDEDHHDLQNVLTPADGVQHSSDLQHFMPTQQVFSEKEQLRQEEYAQNIFHEHPVSVSVLPGQYPRLPPFLRVMAFPLSNVSDFPAPRVDEADLLNYYLLDAASILPVLALDLRPNDHVLDLCAAPGGKTLAMLQIIISQGGHVTSNDASGSRLKRLRSVLRSYLSRDLQAEFVTVSHRSGLSFREPEYNKVLVDVPCNSDRHVLVQEDNNLFKPSRIKERLNMTTLQKDLLLAGIKSCKPGGSVVYSTCTLAAAQNDGVVQAAAEELWETSNIDIAVEDLSPLRTAFAPVFKFHSAVRLGQLVLPTLTSNFGPMYFCKLKRLQ